MNKKYLLLLTLLITSCSSSSNWFGAKEKTPIAGERISVLKLENDLVADRTLSSLEIKLPAVEQNNFWPNSNNSQYILPENIQLTNYPNRFAQIKIFNTVADRELAYFGTPVIANNKIYILNSMGEVKCYSTHDKKKPLWVEKVATIAQKGRTIGGGLQYADNMLYVTYGQNDVVALDADSGKELWRQRLSNLLRSAPVVYDKILLVKTADNKLYTLNSANGAIYWLHEGAFEDIGNLTFSSVAVQNGVVVVPYSTGVVYGLNIANGQELWSDNLFYDQFNPINYTITDLDFTPVIKDHIILIASTNGSLFAIDLLRGNVLWKKDVKGVKGFWVAGEFSYIINEVNELMAVHNKTGGIKWLKNIDKLIITKKGEATAKYSGPVVVDDKLLVVSSQGKLLFLSTMDASLISQIAIPKDINLPPIVVGSKIYLFSDHGKLVELE